MKFGNYNQGGWGEVLQSITTRGGLFLKAESVSIIISVFVGHLIAIYGLVYLVCSNIVYSTFNLVPSQWSKGAVCDGRSASSFCWLALCGGMVDVLVSP